jgi:hypothetical protein
MQDRNQWMEPETLETRDGADRRREPRVPANDSASMNVVDSWSALRVDVRVLDVSKSGMKLSVPRFLNRGTVVQIHLKDSMALAEVRHCLSAGRGYHAGVLLHLVFREPLQSEPLQ